jgi:hypothetical protein
LTIVYSVPTGSTVSGEVAPLVCEVVVVLPVPGEREEGVEEPLV